MTARKPFDVDEAIGHAIERAIEDLRCRKCARGGYTVRVSAPDTGEFSRYACDECCAAMLEIVRRLHPAAEVHDLPRKAHVQKLPL